MYFIFRKNKKGWFWKAKPQSPLKKDGRLKKEYKDRPRYKVIPEYEGKFKENYDKMLNSMTKEIGLTMKKFVK